MAGNTVKVEIGVWYDDTLKQIKLSIPGQGLTSVTYDPASKRGNPSLFKKLGRLLRDKAVKHPAGI